MPASAPLHVFSDFDGTISAPDTIMLLTERLGGGAELYREHGRLLRDGALTLRDCTALQMASIRVPFDEAAVLLRRHVAITPGFPGFARWCAAGGVPLTVLSAGFEEIIALFLPPVEFPALEVRANRLHPETWRCTFRDDTPLGHDKAQALVEARRRGRRTVFIGDGFSDREPARVADEVFAKADLADYCRAQGICFRPFDTFDDVLASLRTHVDVPGSAGTESGDHVD
jgi:2-hydroxy-3-keto-5-methylthiopentenyl-1-phosphate phosphatase